MNRRMFLWSAAAYGAGLARTISARAERTAGAGAGRPNVVVIVSDDQGFADSSCYDHPEHVETPAIDRLAERGVRLTDGYASAWVCAPTRAGLLTGRYQQRFGFYTAGDSRTGLPLSETTLAEILKKQGYATGVFGKWHLGIEPAYHPLRRGFDEFYGFLGHGAHDYFDLRRTDRYTSIYRNETIIDDAGYLTDNLAREAVSFIRRHRREPFLLYLPFNAVHWPLQAPEADIGAYDTGDRNRDIYLAMLRRMDQAIGAVLDALHETGVDENTLVFFFSDNGGARKNHADNGRLRDFKHSAYEGGIRVPFIVSWPGRLPAPSVCSEPVICLDIVPTVCAAVGAELPGNKTYDGKNMLEVLQGKGKRPLHEALFWDDAQGQWAVRMGKWKLLRNGQGQVELYNLELDVGEKNNLIAERPQTAERLKRAYLQWKTQMAPPMARGKNRSPSRNTPKTEARR